MKIFGYNLLTDERLQSLEGLEGKNFQLKADIALKDSLAREQALLISKLRVQVDAEKLKGIIAIDIGDPTPEKTTERREYVARVAGFYKDVLKPKCIQMISTYHRLLEEETNDRETDLILKVGVFQCREWMKWGESAVSEVVANQVDPDKPATQAEQKEELITQIKL